MSCTGTSVYTRLNMLPLRLLFQYRGAALMFSVLRLGSIPTLARCFTYTRSNGRYAYNLLLRSIQTERSRRSAVPRSIRDALPYHNLRRYTKVTWKLKLVKRLIHTIFMTSFDIWMVCVNCGTSYKLLMATTVNPNTVTVRNKDSQSINLHIYVHRWVVDYKYRLYIYISLCPQNASPSGSNPCNSQGTSSMANQMPARQDLQRG